MIVKVRATLGPGPGDDKEVSILNRIDRWCDDCLLHEADPRHVKKLLRDAGLEDCKSVTTPGVKEASATTSTTWFEESGLSPESEGVRGRLNPAADALDAHDAPGLRFLDREEMRSYRSAVARCNYLAQDRSEIAFTTKELCRAMPKPTIGDAKAIARLCRFLKELPRFVPGYRLHTILPRLLRCMLIPIGSAVEGRGSRIQEE